MGTVWLGGASPPAFSPGVPGNMGAAACCCFSRSWSDSTLLSQLPQTQAGGDGEKKGNKKKTAAINMRPGNQRDSKICALFSLVKGAILIRAELHLHRILWPPDSPRPAEVQPCLVGHVASEVHRYKGPAFPRGHARTRVPEQIRPLPHAVPLFKRSRPPAGGLGDICSQVGSGGRWGLRC